MSLFKVNGGRYWHVSFEYGGHRFYGSTKTADRSEAEAIKRMVRDRAQRLGAAVAVASPWRAPSRPYDAADDFSRSLDDCYRAVRERVAAGGKGWEPPPHNPKKGGPTHE
jgi:hypothetical protein